MRFDVTMRWKNMFSSRFLMLINEGLFLTENTLSNLCYLSSNLRLYVQTHFYEFALCPLTSHHVSMSLYLSIYLSPIQFVVQIQYSTKDSFETANQLSAWLPSEDFHQQIRMKLNIIIARPTVAVAAVLLIVLIEFFV